MFKVEAQERERPLRKSDPKLYEHLATLRKLNPEAANYLAKRLFGDSMVEGVGNKLAWEDFQSRPRQGVHVTLDGNDFGTINKRWGQSTGDEAIKAMGAALSRASRASKGKLFRIGGDEFHAHFDTPEQAYTFARNARTELEALPPVQGEHFHSVSMGLGQSPEHSEQALLHAKTAKNRMGYLPGQAQTHAHSLLPGAAGEVPVAAGEPEIPPGLADQKPVEPGQSPMQLPNARDPWPVVKKSEAPLVLVHDNRARPVPVYFLANAEGLSPDGAAFLDHRQLIDWYGDLVAPRRCGYTMRAALAKSVRRSDEGWVTFERA